MSTLRLWAIAISDVRGIMSADPDTADRLRAAAAERFGAGGPVRTGLLGKLGPLLRGSQDPAAPRPGVPGTEDIEDLLAGRYIPPPRLVTAWNLLEFWIDTLALGSGSWQLTEPELNDLDFDLVRAHVSARYGLSEVFKANLGISLTLRPGLAAGFVRGEHAQAMSTAWTAVIGELEPAHQELATGAAEFLSGFAKWAEEARERQHPEPDLVAIFGS
jgi:hypothetical protein